MFWIRKAFVPQSWCGREFAHRSTTSSGLMARGFYSLLRWVYCFVYFCLIVCLFVCMYVHVFWFSIEESLLTGLPCMHHPLKLWYENLHLCKHFTYVLHLYLFVCLFVLCMFITTGSSCQSELLHYPIVCGLHHRLHPGSGPDWALQRPSGKI